MQLRHARALPELHRLQHRLPLLRRSALTGTVLHFVSFAPRFLAPLVAALTDATDDADASLLRGNYAAALLRAGRPAEALPIYRALADRARATANDDDRDLMDVCAAETLFALDRRDEARELFARAVDACDARGALVSPTGIRATDGLVGTLLAVGNDAAITAQQRMLEAARAAYGNEHPATWLEDANVAIILAQRGRRDEARERFASVLERQQASFGENSADAIRTRKNLARLLREMGRVDEATQLEAKLPELESRVVEWAVFRSPQI